MQFLQAAALASLALAWPSTVIAQQSIDYASVSGRVVDASGAVIPEAQVDARHVRTNVSSRAVTDRAGRFRFPYLRIGPYEISVHRDGFTDAKFQLTLTVGAAFELPVTLAMGPLDANVTVSAAATMLESARSQVAATVSETELQDVPLNGRHFLDIGLLAPGVAPANVGGTQVFPETSAVPGISLSVSSQRNLSNNFIVDGLSANDDAAALSGMAYAIDSLEELQVVTSGAHAELGRALGGYVNVVTKSGTNTLHGTAYGYMRDDRLNAATPLTGAKLPMSQAQFGANVGGPVVANRTFYFGSVERRDLDQAGLVTILDGSARVVNARLATVGYPGPPVTTGEYPNPVDTTSMLAKVDHQVNGREQFGVRYSLYDVGARNARGAGGLSAPSASSGLDNMDQTIAFSNTLTLFARTVLETRAQAVRASLDAPPSDPIGPAVSIAGIASFGTLSSSPTGRVNRMYQVVNNLSHQAGAHALKVGADFLYNDDRITFPRAVRGAYSFSSLASFLAGTYNNAGFTQTFGATEVSQTNPNFGAYAQDEWKLGSAVTLNLGIRYDLQFLQTIDTDTDNLSPRAGVAWSPLESGKLVVRANAGAFYDRVPLRALANALLSAGNTTEVSQLRQTIVNLGPNQAGAPVFPQILADIAPWVTLPSLTTMDRHLQNASSRQVGVEVERQLGTRTTVSLGYQYLRGQHLLVSVNQNVPSCTPSGTNNGCRPNPGYANNNQYSAVGSSTYHGLHVSFIHRPASWGHLRLTYTLSKSMNDVGEFFFSAPIDAFDLSKDWARSDDDQRHRLVMNGAIQTATAPAATAWERLTHGFQLSGTLLAYSATPFNILSGVTTIQGTAGRPVVDGAFIGRNAGVGSDFLTLNLRVSRAFGLTGRARLELLAEGFNLTNQRNVLTRNTTFGTGAYPTEPSRTFGQITAVGEPRSFQLAARVRF